MWRASCQDPIPAELQDKVTLTLSCLVEASPNSRRHRTSPVVLGEQASMEKKTQRVQRISTTLADLSAQGLNAQAVHDLLTMCVRGRSLQLRQTCHDLLVPPHSTRHHLSLVFFYLPNLKDLVWALQFSGMLPLHGVLGRRSFPHYWQQPSHQTQTPSSMQHHDSEPN